MANQHLVRTNLLSLQEALRDAATYVDRMRQFNCSPPGGGAYYDLAKQVADACQAARETVMPK